MTRLISGTIFAALGTCVLSSAVFAAPLTNDVSIVSLTNSEANANGASGSSALSSDKTLASFVSSATNLVGSATSNSQCFLRNRTSGTTALISAVGASEGNGSAYSCTISGDGSTVVFSTAATNLGSSPSALSSIYSAAVSSGALTLISNTTAFKGSSAINAAPDISDDGSVVTFLSNEAYGNCTGTTNVFASRGGVLTCLSSDSTILSQENSEVKISGDGTTAAIVSKPDSGDSQIYTVILPTPTATPATTPTAGPTPTATTATPIAATRVSELSAVAGNGSSNEISISEDGTKIAFASVATNLTSPAQGNAAKAIYLYRQGHSPAIVLVSKVSGGTKCSGESSAPAISKNGSYIAFLSTCRDLLTDNPTTTNVAQAYIYSVTGDAVTARASVRSSGGAIDGAITGPLSIDDSGNVVMFSTAVSSVAPQTNDQNSASDVYVFDSSCSSNSDSSGGSDCTDQCPFDSAKDVSEGACGCGFSDGDTDLDGTPDCEDICPSDPLKTTTDRVCGCGNAETDADGNGVPDCADPSAVFVPKDLKFAADPVRHGGILTFPGVFQTRSVTFEYQFVRNGRVILSGTTKSRTYRVRGLALGSYKLRYRVKTTAVSSRWSKSMDVRLRLR